MRRVRVGGAASLCLDRLVVADGEPLSMFFSQVFHLEDIVEQTGYVLEKDSEYSQRILEDEEEVNISVTQKGGKMLQHQVKPNPKLNKSD